MPELPEVETVRKGLAGTVVGRTIERVEVGRLRTVRRTSADALVNGLVGATITAAERRGKYLLLPLDTGEVLMVHLRMTGQVLVVDPTEPRVAHTHVIASLGPTADRSARELRFVDPRTFGEMVVFDPANVANEVPELSVLGIDPLADTWTADDLARVMSRRSTGLKPFLLDQHHVAGIGNIYADEILHAARLHPTAPAGSLRRPEIIRLYATILDVLTAAVAAGGSTLGDAQYVDVDGSSGNYQHDHRVYARGGERCITCGRGFVRRTVQAGRSTHFCPVCQPVRRPRPQPRR